MENETENMNGVKNVIENLKTRFSLAYYKLRPKNKIFGGILSVLILSAAIGTGVYLVQLVQQTKTKAGGVTLSLSTSNANPKVGDTITVAVAIDTGGVAVNGADLRVVYDASVFDFQSISNGSFLTTVLIPSYSFAIPNTTNKAVAIVLGSDPGAPKSGKGLLAQLTFKVKTTSKTAIAIGPATAVSASGQKTNALGTTTPLQINGGGSSTAPTATPATAVFTPVPTATPAKSSAPTSCLPQGTSCTGPNDTRCCAPWGCDLMRKSGGQYKCGIPAE